MRCALADVTTWLELQRVAVDVERRIAAVVGAKLPHRTTSPAKRDDYSAMRPKCQGTTYSTKLPWKTPAIRFPSRTYLDLRGDAGAPLDGLGVYDVGVDADGVHTGDGEG